MSLCGCRTISIGLSGFGTQWQFSCTLVDILVFFSKKFQSLFIAAIVNAFKHILKIIKKHNQLSVKEKVELSVCKRKSCSNRKIAKQLKRSESTRRYYLKNLNNSKFQKTGGR